MPGCMANLYGSIELLDDIYMEKPLTKDVLLSTDINPLLRKQLITILPSVAPPTPVSYYRCNSGSSWYTCRNTITTDPTNTCQRCRCLMNTELTFRAPNVASGSGRTVKDLVRYLITDDLFVLPVTTLSLMKKLAADDSSILQEKEINVGTKEGIDILKASFESDTILSDVFQHYLK